jgi:phosphate transport system substrate-binding protein
MKRLKIYILFILMIYMAYGCSKTPEKAVTETENQISEEQQVQDILQIAGSGSNIPMTQVLLDAYGEKIGIQIVIPPSIGSSGAVKALQADDLELGLISRPLKDSEIESGLKQIKYARIGIVFGINPTVPDDNLQITELVDIYKGSKTTWSNGETIIVQIREAGDSSNAILESQIPGFKEVLDEALSQKKWEVLYTDQEANDAIINTDNSLGLTDTAALVIYDQQIIPMKLNGVSPTFENIKNESYPYYKDLYFAYKEPLTDRASDFIDFVLSDEGQTIMNENGGN